MIFNYDEKNKLPAYQQLYKAVRDEIVKGIFPYNSKLPSKRNLAETTGVSVITVEHAYTLLEDEGYIEARLRSGFYVIYRAEEFVFDATSEIVERNYTIPKTDESQLKGHIQKQDPPFSVPTFSKIMRRVILDYGDRLMGRSPSFGDWGLRNQICLYLARSRGMEVGPEQIVVGSGAEYLYGLLAQYLKGYGSFAIEKPSYEKIRQVYEAEDIPLEFLTLCKDGISSEELRNSTSHVLHVTPFHSYPSGVSADISKKREYVMWAKERKGIIIEDNYDSELTVSRRMEETLFSIAKGEGVIYLNTFSKTIAPSIRAGYMVLPENMVEDFDKCLGFYSCPVPLLEQFFLLEIIKNGEFERHINRVRRYRRQNGLT